MKELNQESVPEKVDFRFRMETDTSTVEGILLNYVRNGYHPSFTTKEMVLRALKGFWLPYAYRDYRKLQTLPIFLKQLAREAIASLKQQARDLERIFELEGETSFPIYTIPGVFIPPHQSEQLQVKGTADDSNGSEWDQLAIENDPFI